MFSLYAFTAEQGWISTKVANVVKNFLTVISNDISFILLTLNHIIDEVNCCEHGVTFARIVCKKKSLKGEVLQIFKIAS